MKSVIPLLLFLLGCAGIYVGTVQAAFTALMRLSLRLSAERTDPNDTLTRVPRRAAPALHPGAHPPRHHPGRLGRAAPRCCSGSAPGASVAVLALLILGFVDRLRAPRAAADRPRQPAGRRSSSCCRRSASSPSPLLPLTLALLGLVRRRDAEGAADRRADAARRQQRRPRPSRPRREEASDDEARLLRSIVDFGDTLVREIMTPRPDIVAIPRRGDARRAAGAVPRAGLLARPGVPGQPRQHPRASSS